MVYKDIVTIYCFFFHYCSKLLSLACSMGEEMTFTSEDCTSNFQFERGDLSGVAVQFSFYPSFEPIDVGEVARLVRLDVFKRLTLALSVLKDQFRDASHFPAAGTLFAHRPVTLSAEQDQASLEGVTHIASAGTLFVPPPVVPSDQHDQVLLKGVTHLASVGALFLLRAAVRSAEQDQDRLERVTHLASSGTLH